MSSKKVKKSILETKKIIVFKNIKENELILNLKEHLNDNDNEFPKLEVEDLIYKLIEISIKEGLQGDIWHNYLKKQLIESENIFTLEAEMDLINKNDSLYQIALNDIKIMADLFSFSFSDLTQKLSEENFSYLQNFRNNKLKINNEKLEIYNSLFNYNSTQKNLESLIKFYQKHGTGILNQSKAFYWENKGLKKINNPDPISFNDLISYQREKRKLIENTKSFLKGYQAHNVLLYGDSGTGKSSSVKALLNKFHGQGLRLIEINSSQIKELPDIIDYLGQRGLYFIIFMDDLSFEEFETDYKYLKAMMEGGVESRPANVLFYATSNRRHLVREKWQDRESEIHENDILNEKLSLSERFGLTLMFNNPSQAQYLKIVKELANNEGLDIKSEKLKNKALKWSKWNNGRSGRSARQFINQLLKEQNLKLNNNHNI